MSFRPTSILASAALLLSACARHQPLVPPSFEGGGLLAGAATVPSAMVALLGARLSVSPTDRFGSEAVSHSHGQQVSFFMPYQETYFILNSGCRSAGTELVLEGYWRHAKSTSQGLARFYVQPPALATQLCAGTATAPIQPSFSGSIGIENATPTSNYTLAFSAQRVDISSRFNIIAHHGACRTIDECGTSENTLESIRNVEIYGASMVELDVQITRDGVPVLFHDANFTDRLVDGQYCHGNVADMPLTAIRTYCRLKYGEQIPTVAEALTDAINNTTLSSVWLDLKDPAIVAPLIPIIQAAQALATAQSRTITFLMDLPEKGVIDAYSAAGGGVPCLIEEDSADLATYGCGYWGPRFTRGSLTEEVRSVQGAGKKVYFWTINDQVIMDFFLKYVRADGIITDRPGVLLQRGQVYSSTIMSAQ